MRPGPSFELVALAGLLPPTVAHLRHGASNVTLAVDGGAASATAPWSTNSSVSLNLASDASYFTDAAYSSLLITHVALMIWAWLFILPIGRPISYVF